MVHAFGCFEACLLWCLRWIINTREFWQVLKPTWGLAFPHCWFVRVNGTTTCINPAQDFDGKNILQSATKQALTGQMRRLLKISACFCHLWNGSLFWANLLAAWRPVHHFSGDPTLQICSATTVELLDEITVYCNMIPQDRNCFAPGSNKIQPFIINVAYLNVLYTPNWI